MPHQYLTVFDQPKSLTGLDVALLRFFAEKVSRSAVYTEVCWPDFLAEISEGTKDVVFGASYTKERGEIYHYSTPYREEVNTLFLAQMMPNFQAQSLPDVLTEIRAKNIKISVVRRFVFGDPRANYFVEAPENKDFIVWRQDSEAAIQAVLDGGADGCFVDRLNADVIIMKKGLENKLSEHPLHIQVPIHFIFSKKTVPLALVEEFNRAIKGQ